MMPQNVSGWWTDEKVKETVTSRYVHSHLRPNEAELLTKSVFGDLSDDTYLEWILTRARRFFLALLDAGVPDQIFGIIDDSYDDEDLPIPEDEVQALRLSPQPDKALDRRFYKAQFKYLIRVVGDGEHIRYAKEETLPIISANSKQSINNLSKESLEKVTLPPNSQRVFLRKRVKLAYRSTEEDTLIEIADCRRLAHQHVLSVFGSYTSEENLFVLLTPSAEYTLKSFLADTPKAYEALAKPDRRRMLLNWCHCLANGLAWLHHNGRHHGCIRPSRIQLDEKLNICFGQLDGEGVLGSNTVKDDIEAYQYAAPERWKRSVTVQSTGNGNMTLPSGGRTGRKIIPGNEGGGSITGSSDSSGRVQRLNTMRPTSTSYAFMPTAKGNRTRLRLGMTNTMNSLERRADRFNESRQSNRTVRAAQSDEARNNASSAMSSSSNDSVRMNHVFVTAPELRTAVVQTWASAQHDMLAADVFALGTIIMEILTALCKHSSSAFARHRSSKNRVAGRGGGIADASFHANLGQVAAWAQMLQKDAEKRIKKEDGTVFKAVGPILQIVMQCMEREPQYRLSAEDLAMKLEEHIRDFASIIGLHCALDLESGDHTSQVGDHVESAAPTRRPSKIAEKAPQIPKANPKYHHALADNSFLNDPTPSIDESSSNTRQFFNFDFDAGSETVVEPSVDGSSSSYGVFRSPVQREFESNPPRTTENLSYRPKRVSWDLQDEDRRRETISPQRSPAPSGPESPVSPVSPVHPPVHPQMLSENLRLPSSGDRSSYHFPPPPTQSPARRLPAIPVQIAPAPAPPPKRPTRTTSTKTGNRASRTLQGIMDSSARHEDTNDIRSYMQSLRGPRR